MLHHIEESQINEEIIKNSIQNIKNYTQEKIMNKYNEIIKKILWNSFFSKYNLVISQ